jgi:phospholipase C
MASSNPPSRRGRRWWPPIAAVLIAVAVVVPVVVVLRADHGAPSVPSQAERIAFDEHVQHIVFVVLENHAFDNYFGAYCPAVNSVCPTANSGLPAGLCVPMSSTSPGAGCIRPFAFTRANWTIQSPLPHNAESSLTAYAGGAMDGFYTAERSGLDPFGFYTAATAPIYWDMAQEYALDDNFFSSVLSYSLPNHWHIVAGAAPAQSFDHLTLPGNTAGTGKTGVNISGEHLYLNQSNQTRSIEDLLLSSQVSWKYYDYLLGSYAAAIHLTALPDGTVTRAGSAYNYWNPQAAKAESYNQSFESHFALNTQFYADAASGSLPELSWVIPPGQDSDHPPSNSSSAQEWLASIVDAVEASPDWNTTVVYVAWDDYGGFYDNVAPPSVSGQQLGFRVPLLIVGPYVRPGYISSNFGYFESILHLMEWRFGLGCLTPLDCNAPLPLDSFNFAGPPRAPTLFPTNISSAAYPLPASYTSPPPPGGYVPPPAFTNFPAGELPDVD